MTSGERAAAAADPLAGLHRALDFVAEAVTELDALQDRAVLGPELGRDLCHVEQYATELRAAQEHLEALCLDWQRRTGGPGKRGGP